MRDFRGVRRWRLSSSVLEHTVNVGVTVSHGFGKRHYSYTRCIEKTILSGFRRSIKWRFQIPRTDFFSSHGGVVYHTWYKHALSSFYKPRVWQVTFV